MGWRECAGTSGWESRVCDELGVRQCDADEEHERGGCQHWCLDDIWGCRRECDAGGKLWWITELSCSGERTQHGVNECDSGWWTFAVGRFVTEASCGREWDDVDDVAVIELHSCEIGSVSGDDTIDDDDIGDERGGQFVECGDDWGDSEQHCEEQWYFNRICECDRDWCELRTGDVQ